MMKENEKEIVEPTKEEEEQQPKEDGSPLAQLAKYEAIIDDAKGKIKEIKNQQLEDLKTTILGLHEEKDKLDRNVYNQKDIRDITGATTVLVRNTIKDHEDSLAKTGNPEEGDASEDDDGVTGSNTDI